MRLTATGLTLLLALCGRHLCWHTTGHFLTALVAKGEIKRRDPALIPYLESILKVLSGFTKERVNSFVEEASFPDDIKYLDWKSFNAWHFGDNFEYRPDAPNKDLPRNPQNLTWALEQCRATLANRKTAKVSLFFSKSFMLRYLVHLVGDIHQPLHNTSLVSKLFPRGDAGGNDFEVKLPGVSDLHSLWDMCLKQYPEIRSPLSDAHFEFLQTTADALVAEFPRTKLRKLLEERDFDEWSRDSKQLALDFAYGGIDIGDTPSDAYIKKGFVIVRQQLALGGYRLADLLLEIFAKDNRPPVNVRIVARPGAPAAQVGSNKIQTALV